jgi:hypothetical protein
LGVVLFALAHFCIFCPIVATHPTYVFPLLVDDMHIISPTSNVLFVFLWLLEEFGTLRLLVKLTKCVAWFP